MAIRRTADCEPDSATAAVGSSAGGRGEIVRQYLPLVHRVVQHLVRARRIPIEREDMVSWGIVGLMDAIGKYDPDKGATFATYAEYRIRGTLLDQLRSSDWVPRSVREKARTIEDASRELEGELGRRPSEQEVATRLGLPLSHYHDLRTAAAGATLTSLEEICDGARDWCLERGLEDTRHDPVQVLLLHERAAVVSEGLGRLSERERLVMRLYYGDHLRMKEVARVLGVTESRVSQLHSQAVGRLKRYVKQRLETDEPGADRPPAAAAEPAAAAPRRPLAIDVAVPLRRVASS